MERLNTSLDQIGSSSNIDIAKQNGKTKRQAKNIVTKNSKRAYLTPKTDLKVLLDKSQRSTKIRNNLFYPQDIEQKDGSFEFDDVVSFYIISFREKF